jgi:hypothetical protein
VGLNTIQRQGVVYFTGYEVEHTIAYGMKTLFVVGTPDYAEIKTQAVKQDCKHIYYGTSQSFNPKELSQQEYSRWDNVILPALKDDFWVTLDFDIKHAEGVIESGYSEYQKFIPMISCKLPYIQQFNYNATLKLDDTTWGHSNPGVWTHQLHDLMAKDKYTYWDQYTQDEEIK